MTKPNLLELPLGAQLVYLAEGGANIIYRIVLTSSNPHNGSKRDTPPGVSSLLQNPIDSFVVPAQLKGKLLRLRKETKFSISYQENVRNFDQTIRPLFNPDELIDQELVCLPKGLVSRCNEQLRAAELSGRRPKHRRGVYLCATEPFGLLVTDMTSFGNPGAVLAELKPKWLLQSPTAPVNARRCRTCALREMKNHELHRGGKAEVRSFCPLDITSDKFDNVLRATRFVKGCKDHGRLARVLYRNSTVQKLLTHQKAKLQVGLHGPAAQSREKSLAMTIRDCTMYIKMPRDESLPVEVRFGDLDLKTGVGGKAQYWLDLEKHLTSEGWYMGIKNNAHPSECMLQGPRTPYQLLM
ncbi:Inositol-pentakisphosphate 2-kinase [Aspergillus nanangensis]|uniref:Inositol-pentakisphosphate 2-kinase n=1 Tax=Aspergillus nanangensis TaxID=2582783 RepID=A0AAD4CR29_ASPNN|nr:Inositol-pentakisphosphate 2-kinase [Aspergillus nanangensis]